MGVQMEGTTTLFSWSLLVPEPVPSGATTLRAGVVSRTGSTAEAG